MKTFIPALAILAALAAPGAPEASCRGPACSNLSLGDPPARLASRYDTRDARIAITPETGEAVLLLTDDVVALQLSDRTLHRIWRKMKDEEKEGPDAVLAHVFKVAVFSSVRALLSSSAEIPVRDLRDVEYRNGRLVFTTKNGERVFGHVRVNDRDMMAGFAESDARLFVNEFHRVQARTR